MALVLARTRQRAFAFARPRPRGNVAAAERNQAAALAASFEVSYSNILSSIMNNPEIPATERQRYMDHAARIRDSNLALVEQMFAIELQWGTGSGGGGTPTVGGPTIPGTRVPGVPPREEDRYD